MCNKLKWQNYLNSRLTIINFDDEKIYSYLQLLTRTGLRVWLEWRKNIYHVLFLNLNWHFNPHFTKVIPELLFKKTSNTCQLTESMQLKWKIVSHINILKERLIKQKPKIKKQRMNCFLIKNGTILESIERSTEERASCLP